MQIIYQERIGEAGEPLAVPVIPATARARMRWRRSWPPRGAAVLSDEQHARLEAHFREGVTPDGIAH